MFLRHLAAAIIFLFLEWFFSVFFPVFPVFEKYCEKSHGFRKFSLCKEQKMGYNKV